MQPGYLVPQGPQAGYAMAPGPFAHPTYSIKRPAWSFLGRKFYVHSPDGALAMFVKHPLLKLRQEFTIFADERETQPLITIRSRQIIALNVAHDVFDARTGERIGSIRSRGLKSMVRDTWDILDPNDQPVGLVQEDGAALLRRFFPLLLGKWHVELYQQEVARIRQVFRFFSKEFTLDLTMCQGRMDTRFAVACAILALMAETQRESRG